MTKQQPLRFPKRFLWGASLSAHQAEGGTHNQWSAWELDHAKANAAAAEYHFHDVPVWSEVRDVAKQPGNYVSGGAVDHYHRYEEDFQFLQKLGLNSFRFSIEWSRVEPHEGTWNSEAIAHYVTYVKRLKELNIEPIVTLFHFTVPRWFEELGGFEKRSNVQYFTRFAEKIMSELAGNVRYIITLNEPTIYATKSYYGGEWPPGKQNKWSLLKVLHNLALAHNKTAKMLHTINRRYRVAVAHNSAYYYPGDDAWLSRISAAFLQYVGDDYFLRKIVKQSDFIGVNYYFSNRVYGYRVHNPDEVVSDLGWGLQPENIEFTLERIWQKYKLPLIVTEAGVADMNDDKRQWVIAEHIKALARARNEGVDVQGYLHWSLLDNYEWGYGLWARFGLVRVDDQTKAREIRQSALWYGRVVKKLRQSS